MGIQMGNTPTPKVLPWVINQHLVEVGVWYHGKKSQNPFKLFLNITNIPGLD
jgi:hypothetical protein